MKRVKDLQDKGKYVVASFGDYAASGGYYIAAAADKIVAEPTTLTGSIGVFSMMPDFSEVSEEELGILWDTIGTGKRTFMYSTFVSRSNRDNALLMAETERIYDQFKSVVADGRSMDDDSVEKVAQGRVWSGTDGIEVGLVDTIGGLNEAIQIAANAVGYEDFKTLEYPVIKKDFWELLLEGINENTEVQLKVNTIGHSVFDQLIETLKVVEAACTTPQARLPFTVAVQ